jgi:transcriptional regulator with XRE-family HTH domain
MMFFMTDKTRLRTLRETAGISLRELARQLGEHPSNVSFWERTGKIPRSNVLAPMAKVLGVSVEELLGEKPPRRSAPAGRARQSFEQISELPRSQQKKILDVVDALLVQVSS